MTKQNAPQERRDDVLVGVLNALAAAARTTQIKTFHGLVPAVVELRRVIDQLDDLAGLDAYRAKRRSAVTSQLSAARNHIAECVQAIEARASGAGYPLGSALARSLRESWPRAGCRCRGE